MPLPDKTNCTIPGHEITRSFGEVVDGMVEVECLCWSCLAEHPIKTWTELWRFESVVQDKEPSLK